MRALALAAVAIGLLAPAAEASHLSGRAWPGGRVTYAVTSKSMRTPVRAAALAWNRSGLDVQLVEVSRSKARLLISPLPKGTCFGAIGEALVGYTGGFQSFMHLQPNCPEGTLTMTAAHEFGHVLGLKHENRRCSLMNSVFVSRCHPQPLEWEWYCSPPRDDDRLGLLRRYGGKFRRASLSLCVSRTLPGRVRSLGDAADPVDSLARVRISFQTPSSTTLRRVIVTRRRGRLCGDTPISRSVPIVQREGITPRFGTLVAEVPRAARAAVVAVEDLAVTGTGTWCYAVFTLDRRNRWRSAGQRIVTRGPEAPLAKRLGLVGGAGGADRSDAAVDEPAHAASGRAGAVRSAGACPADATQVPVYTNATKTPGAATFTDAAAGAGTWCYGLRFTALQPGARPTTGARAGLPRLSDTWYMPSRSKGMHIHGTRVGASRFRRHLTRTSPSEPGDPFETTAARISRGHAVERLEHLHTHFELEHRFMRDDAA